MAPEEFPGPFPFSVHASFREARTDSPHLGT